MFLHKLIELYMLEIFGSPYLDVKLALATLMLVIRSYRILSLYIKFFCDFKISNYIFDHYFDIYHCKYGGGGGTIICRVKICKFVSIYVEQDTHTKVFKKTAIWKFANNFTKFCGRHCAYVSKIIFRFPETMKEILRLVKNGDLSC